MGIEGKTILLTRASGQNADFRQHLEHIGARVIEIPTIEIAEPQSWDAVDTAIAQVADYDWVIFTSANAVGVFLDRSGPVRFANLAAVGIQTARSLKDRGHRVDLIPERFNAAGLLEELPANLKGVRVLLPRAEIADPALPRTLQARGAELDVVTLYSVRTPRGGRGALRRLLEARDVDCIPFTSGSTVHNLIEMLEGADPQRLLDYPRIAVIGPMTRREVIKAGLRVDIEASAATIADLIAAISQHFG